MKEPLPVELTPTEIDELKKAIHNIPDDYLNAAQKNVLSGIFNCMLWMVAKLEESKLSIKRLRRLFGFKTEKKDCSAVVDLTKSFVGPPCPADLLRRRPRKKGHGRLPASDYTGAKEVIIPHEVYQHGTPCPDLCGGKLYRQEEPGVIVKVKGNSLFDATKYVYEKFRCNLCLKICSAALPSEAILGEKYDDKAKIMTVLNRYQMGVPMYRQARWQEQIGVPLPEGTQWQLIVDVYEIAAPIFEELVCQAAQGNMFYLDDTSVTILEIIKKAKTNQDTKSAYTTGIISENSERRIYLYFSGKDTAGKNLTSVLHDRQNEDTVMTMNDALSANNISTELKRIECNCLAHGRRKILEVEDYAKGPCEEIINCIAGIYHHDEHCKKNHFSSQARLEYHKTHSAPLCDKIKTIMKWQFEDKVIEPNSGVGKAFEYWLNRWPSMTRFLECPGAPLDNNILEQGLKMAILFRKNSLFFKTKKSAKVGSDFMSIIKTCLVNGINPVEYFLALMKNKTSAREHPALWMPWNYKLQVSPNDEFKNLHPSMVA